MQSGGGPLGAEKNSQLHDAAATQLQALLEERKTDALKQDAAELMEDERFAEAVDVLKEALRLAPGCAETQAALEKAEAGAAAA